MDRTKTGSVFMYPGLHFTYLWFESAPFPVSRYLEYQITYKYLIIFKLYSQIIKKVV